jgi:glucokinase
MVLGVEIGGTKQQIAVCDDTANIVEMVSERVRIVDGASDILRWLSNKIPALLDKYEITAIGVGFGGPLETASGRVLISLQVPGWKDFELKTWFEAQFARPTVVVNDTVAGGYAELLKGAGRGSNAFFYTNIGTGIGGAFYIGGKPWDGIGFGASYFGNTYVSEPPKRIEDFCSGTAIERRLREGIPADSLMKEPTCRALHAAARQGDAFALAELDRVGYYFGLGIANLVTMLGVDRIAIGGGVGNMREYIVNPIAKYAREYVFISGRDRFEVCASELLDDNVPIGAALFAIHGFESI